MLRETANTWTLSRFTVVGNRRITWAEITPLCLLQRCFTLIDTALCSCASPGLHVLLSTSRAPPAQNRVVAQSTFWHGPEGLRSFRVAVSIQAADGLEALLTPSRPGCCSNVNKQGERASGVIRPKGGGTLPSIIIVFFQWLVCTPLHSHKCYIILFFLTNRLQYTLSTDVCSVCVIRLRHSAIRIYGLLSRILVRLKINK